MILIRLADILVGHPLVILFGLALFSTATILAPLFYKTLPSFKDPQLGFETRGTNLSDRLVSWKNLVESTRASSEFVYNPQDIVRYNMMKNHKQKAKKNHKPKSKKSHKLKSKKKHTKPNMEMNATDPNGIFDIPREKEYIHVRKHTPRLDYFCGNPVEQYVHLVIKADDSGDLFSLDNLRKICNLEMNLKYATNYRNLCLETPYEPKECCRPWSIGDYIAALNDRTSCLAITEEDIIKTKKLLTDCAGYFHTAQLKSDCARDGCSISKDCEVIDAVFNIMNYLVPTTFLPASSENNLVVPETIIMLPMACSLATLPYYKSLDSKYTRFEDISVVAMQFGLKNILFDECLRDNTWLVGLSGAFIMICMWLYTQSLFLTIMTIITIVLSLGISYFFYVVVFRVVFFPFMNLLAIVVAIGIGTDDAFIFCKVWNTLQKDSTMSINKIMHETLTHSLPSMFVTSLTTAVAFFTSYLSSITALRCFGVFTGMAVLINYILMITWFPAAISIWQMKYKSYCNVCINNWCVRPRWNRAVSKIRSDYVNLMETCQKYIVNAVITCKYVLFTVFTIIAIAGFAIVFYYPKLQLPNSSEFQLFDSAHPFEQYELMYRHNFWFSHTDKGNADSDDSIYKLPLRFVWGVLPVDNGNHMDPQSLGTIELDSDFSISEPEAQVWLLQFCKDLRKQSFYQYSDDTLQSRCFIESFITWMGRRCEDPIDSTVDLSPCCEESTFPYNSSVFEKCIVEAMTALYETPSTYFIATSAGPRFSTDGKLNLQAIIIEFDSKYTYSPSYHYMEMFMNVATSWFHNQLLTAPASLKNGWFVSDYDFYDLQLELSENTYTSIILSVGLALVVIGLCTLNVLNSIYAVFTILCSITTTMAALVLYGWKLNILESVAITSSIGLSVDFSLHYTVNYRLCPVNEARSKEGATKFALTSMLGPITMAAVTTAASGAFMLPSEILAYKQIGQFLVTIMFVSWMYATFHLGAMLAIAGPEKQFGQLRYPCSKRRRGPGEVVELQPGIPTIGDEITMRTFSDE